MCRAAIRLREQPACKPSSCRSTTFSGRAPPIHVNVMAPVTVPRACSPALRLQSGADREGSRAYGTQGSRIFRPQGSCLQDRQGRDGKRPGRGARVDRRGRKPGPRHRARPDRKASGYRAAVRRTRRDADRGRYRRAGRQGHRYLGQAGRGSQGSGAPGRMNRRPRGLSPRPARPRESSLRSRARS